MTADLDYLRWRLDNAELMAVDPGNERVGVSLWEPERYHRDTGWHETWNGIVTPDDFADAMAEGHGDEQAGNSLRFVIVEDWRLDHSRNRGGSQMIASEVIGMARVRASIYRFQTEFVRQRPEAYKVAAMHAGIELPKGHCPDDLSAKLHARYFLTERFGLGVIEPVTPA